MRSVANILIFISVSASAADYMDVVANSSYLSDTKYQSQTPIFVVLDKNKEVQLTDQYTSINRYYEARQAAGAMTIEDEINYNNSMNSFSQNVFSEVKSYQMNSQQSAMTGKLKSNSDINGIMQAGKVPAAVVGGAYSIYKGTSYKIRLSDNTSVTPGASVQGRKASMSLASPFLNASISADQQNLISTVSRGIVNHVSVTISNTHPTQAGMVPSSSVGLNYGIGL